VGRLPLQGVQVPLQRAWHASGTGLMHIGRHVARQQPSVAVSKPPNPFCSCCAVLVEQHPDQQGPGVPAEQRVGGGVLGEVEGRHAPDPARPARMAGCVPW
jgi:hypothetical protein